ncbi:MAG: hypothetical protein OEV74_21445, partial [Cyclobacteriaceae bacterium]|nr:hypothetical protein [Cyclobacteriaceae bacterium]
HPISKSQLSAAQLHKQAPEMILALFDEIEMAPSIVIGNVKKLTQFDKLNISPYCELIAGMKDSKLNHPILAVTAHSQKRI